MPDSTVQSIRIDGPRTALRSTGRALLTTRKPLRNTAIAKGMPAIQRRRLHEEILAHSTLELVLEVGIQLHVRFVLLHWRSGDSLSFV